MEKRLTQAVEQYFSELFRRRATGGGTGEMSYYSALGDLLNAVGAELDPKVFHLPNLANQGAGHPDFGLFAKNQCQRGEPRPGAVPERGVVEVKPLKDETWLTAETTQVTTYWQRYGLVLVTNYRAFQLVGRGSGGEPSRLESFVLANSEAAFWAMASTPRTTASSVGVALVEYLKRVLTHGIALRDPKDVAWFLASYARDALARVEAKATGPALLALKQSLETSLGVHFQGAKGVHFFHSTLVQTLFYGVFAAWVLWTRKSPPPPPGIRFDWHNAVWELHVPMLRALFHQLADPNKLESLTLVEVLDWTAAALNRVEVAEFFSRFREAEAVQYFYEPFLEAFDPELRKQLGVWYTPPEVVTYMVERVDRALRDDLGVEGGLAADNVYVLDPCTGTGSFLVQVFDRIARTLDDPALAALKLKQAATSRIFGFELMPAPFVIAHLQVGLMLREKGAPLKDPERVGVFLTNALTGWEPAREVPKLPFAELEEEREKAAEVKQEKPILVILGNPPYNGFAGVAIDEERELTEAYRQPKRVRRPEGQGLNDLYVRFFRMAERRIVDKTGQGVICFISNYSWLDGLSFTAMRERFLDAFDIIRVDCLNGDKYKTGKVTPEGLPDPSIFSTSHNREGIQVGTAIALLTRTRPHTPAAVVGFRHLWGVAKRQELLETADGSPEEIYQRAVPPLDLGLPFVAATVQPDYLQWPRLPELFPTSFPGVKTSRDEFLVDIDRETLLRRLHLYFDPSVSHDEMKRICPAVMTTTARFKAEETRDQLRKRGFLPEHVIRYYYRPFDVRWLYWEPDTNLLDRERAGYRGNTFKGNTWLSAGQRNRKSDFYQPQIAAALADHHIVESNVAMFPLWLAEQSHITTSMKRPNVMRSVAEQLAAVGLTPEDLFFHILAILHAAAYHNENAGGLRMDWPRVPFPIGADALRSSATLGRALSGLLDPEHPVTGVTAGGLRPDLKCLARTRRNGGGPFGEDDLRLTAGWGYRANGAVMPGQGRAVARAYTDDERDALAAGAAERGMALEQLLVLLGETTFDVWLNADACWSNVPAKVWAYTLGGYQVIKKWLSYREEGVLGRPLKVDEVQYVSQVVRRIAAILLLSPALNESYEAAKQSWCAKE